MRLQLWFLAGLKLALNHSVYFGNRSTQGLKLATLGILNHTSLDASLNGTTKKAAANCNGFPCFVLVLKRKLSRVGVDGWNHPDFQFGFDVLM